MTDHIIPATTQPADHRAASRDEACMRLALELAKAGAGRVSPNPLVGCVVTNAAGEVIGRGAHLKNGEAHAEPNAIRDAEAGGHDVRGGTIYVTLEPHSHVSRTPPCCDLIIEKQFARCVVAMLDPNPNVSGEGVRRIQAAGVRVEVGLLQEEARELARFYVTQITTGRPYVTLKLASSLDGRSALANGAARWITSPASRALVHVMRAEQDAVLVGTRTAYLDDPSLTVRDADGHTTDDRQPRRIVLDRELRLPLTMRLFSDEHCHRTIVVTGAASATSEKASHLRSVGVEVLASEVTESGLALEPLLDLLGRRGLTSLLVEAGPTLAGSLVRATLADEIALFQAPILLGADARPIIDAMHVTDLAAADRYELRSVRRVEPSDDLFVQLRRPASKTGPRSSY